MRLKNLSLGLLGTLALAAAAQAQVSIVDTLPGAFIDISATGTDLMAGDDTEHDILTTVGNELLAPGTVRVGSNGGIRFAGAGTQLGFTNGPIPNASNSGSTGCFEGGQTLLPFWDDMSPNLAGQVLWEEIGDTLIIQWNAVAFFGAANAGQVATFQVQVHGSGPIAAQFIYQDIEQPRPNGGESATIGYQAGGFGSDVTYSLDTPMAVSNGTVLSLVYCEIPLFESICGPAVPNSTGNSGEMAATGTRDLASNDLVLHASQLPMNSSGFFFTSLEQNLVVMPGNSVGNICIASLTIGRYDSSPLNSGATGEVSLAIDLSATPQQPGGPVAVQPGETRYFQYWYRDMDPTGAAINNFTDAICVTFH